MNKFERAFIDGFMKAAGVQDIAEPWTPSPAPGAQGDLLSAGKKLTLANPIPNTAGIKDIAEPWQTAAKPGALSALAGKVKGGAQTAGKGIAGMVSKNPRTAGIGALLATLLGATGLSRPDSSVDTSAMQGPPAPAPTPTPPAVTPNNPNLMDALKKSMSENKLAWGAGLGGVGALGGLGLAHAMSPDKEKEQRNAVQIPA